jgi:hypothetical protein
MRHAILVRRDDGGYCLRLRGGAASNERRAATEGRPYFVKTKVVTLVAGSSILKVLFEVGW